MPPQTITPLESASARWQLKVLGAARLENSEKTFKLERRTAAVLAFLALEGEAVKYHLAGCLWANSLEATARNNMRQLLRRLRTLVGEEIIVGDDRLQLAPNVLADASTLRAQTFAANHMAVLEHDQELLAGLAFDDCPDFEEWLFNARAGLAALRRSAAVGMSETLEQLGDFSGALRFALLQVQLESLSEDAHRRVMRLHYLAGDRAAALAAFESCKVLLERELGVEPLPETLALAAEIERGENLPQPSYNPRNVPLAVLRPPVLAGRVREWAQLESAWEKGQAIFICGEAGVGKSRLALDFATSKGSVFRFSARPGDANVPYSSQARAIREILLAQPEILEQLPDWVRNELSRLLPELIPTQKTEPLQSEALKLRFYNAVGMVLRAARNETITTVSDDVQFADSASSEMVTYLISNDSNPGQQGGLPRIINVFRRGELPADSETMISNLVNAGIAIRIELYPLGHQEVQDLLESLNVPNVNELGAALTHYAGGNPLFVLETVRHLIETGQLERGLPSCLPPPGKVAPLVQTRLERLSKSAQSFAQAAAILESDFSFELLCDLLGVSALEAMPVWTELENAQVMTGAHFSHDLIFEGVRAYIPETVRVWLHRRAAGALEAHRANPARIANHWLEGNEGARAAPWFVQAAERASGAYRFTEAANFLNVAAKEFESAGERAKTFEAFYKLAGLLPNLESKEHFEQVTNDLMRLAKTKLEEARAWHAKALMYGALGEHQAIETAARNGLECLAPNAQIELELLLHERLGSALWHQGRYHEARVSLQRTVELSEVINDSDHLIEALNNLGIVLGDLNELQAASACLERAAELTEFIEDRIKRAAILASLAKFNGLIGHTRTAVESLSEARGLLENVEGAFETRLATEQAMGACWRMLGEYSKSLEAVNTAIQMSGTGSSTRFWRETLEKDRALILMALGDFGSAEAELERLMSNPDRMGTLQGIICYSLALIRLQTGREAEALFDQARGLLDPNVVDHSYTCSFLIARASSLPPNEALETAIQAEEFALELGRAPIRIAALTRKAQTLLALRRKAEALESSTAAVAGYSQSNIAILERSEVLFTHFCALEAVGDARASEVLREALDWVTTTARDHVPEKYRQSYLERNLTSRAVLEAAKRYDLEP